MSYKIKDAVWNYVFQREDLGKQALLVHEKLKLHQRKCLNLIIVVDDQDTRLCGLTQVNLCFWYLPRLESKDLHEIAYFRIKSVQNFCEVEYEGLDYGGESFTVDLYTSKEEHCSLQLITHIQEFQ